MNGSITVLHPIRSTMLPAVPLLNEDEIAAMLRDLRKRMPVVEMQRLSGVDRQVLYRLMGGSSINRTPYELVVKVVAFLSEYYAEESAAESPVESLLTGFTVSI